MITRRQFIQGMLVATGGAIGWMTFAQGVRPGSPKRIVICADGTWNEPERPNPESGRPEPTNVQKVARAVLTSGADGVDQVVYYHYGVGTGGGMDRITGGAFGEGIELNVRQLYRFIVFNYEPGDEIFLFGFSRGAFTVRTLAGFMYHVGLLTKDDEYYTPELFQLYASSVEEGSAEWKHGFRNISEVRKPPIKFVGVWDTVGALGAPGALGQLFNKDKYKYHKVDLNPLIQNAFHALAIDERRKAFAPTFFNRPKDWQGQLEQVWFAGVHSNIGGSYSTDGLANIALHWMATKASLLGLAFSEAKLSRYPACLNGMLNDSKKGIYHLMGEYVRPIGTHLADGEAIHESATQRLGEPACKYAAANLKQALSEGRVPVVATADTPLEPCGPKAEKGKASCLGYEA